MESVFVRFDSYSFESDKRFQSGLVSLEESSISRDHKKVLEMKLFFYNRFVEPIDSTGYKQWRLGSSRLTSTDRSTEQLDQQTLSGSDSGISENNSEETSTDTGAAQLSFEEVMRLVQAGEEVPGVIKLDIQPSNQNPTPSQMGRMLKPWEISSVSE
ncbi:uncharacterized protein LOC144542323 [Centroberyx gerrardi]